MTDLNNVLDRLRGITRVPITDGLGPVNGGDSPTEYVTQFEMPPHYPMPGSPLSTDAIALIEHQAAQIAELKAANQRLVNAKMPQDGLQWAYFGVVTTEDNKRCIAYVKSPPLKGRGFPQLEADFPAQECLGRH